MIYQLVSVSATEFRMECTACNQQFVVRRKDPNPIDTFHNCKEAIAQMEKEDLEREERENG